MLPNPPKSVTSIQLGYVVSDIAAAMSAWRSRAHIGPFYLLEGIHLTGANYRGAIVDVSLTAALAQMGDVQIELILQESEGKSVFTEKDGGSCALHHIGYVVDEAEQYIAALAALGHEPALTATAPGGFSFAYVDTTSSLGHMMEISPCVPAIVELYEEVRRAALNWDGRDPIRRVG